MSCPASYRGPSVDFKPPGVGSWPRRPQIVVIHQARTVANIDEEKACRTKLAAEIRDVNKIVAKWDRHGWHWVTYYREYRRPVETISALRASR